MTYNLVDEPWIPVLGLDGETRFVGIMEALTRAGEYLKSPHQTPSTG